MFEKLSKFSANFMMTILERSLHILGYKSVWGVVCVIEKLAKKVTIHSYTLKPKPTSILEKITSKVDHLIMKNALCPTLTK